MPFPGLTRKLSSLAVLVDQERQNSSSRRGTADEEPQQTKAQLSESPVTNAVQIHGDSKENEEGGGTDIEGGDTDTDVENEPEIPSMPSPMRKTASMDHLGKTLPRMSRRLMSMKRRGRLQPMVEVQEEFEFCAGDCLTVRGEDQDFFLCRVLEDVLEAAENFRVSWFNRIDENVYEPSFDDVCSMVSVITRVTLLEHINGTFSLPKKHVRQTKKLLREALMAERGEQILDETDEDDDDDEDDDEIEEEPPAKRTRHSAASTTPSPRKGRQKKSSPTKQAMGKKRKAAPPKGRKEKVEAKPKARRPGVLIPNPQIKLLDQDPTFESREDLSLMPCKLPIRAVLLNDVNMLKQAIDNVDEVHSVNWPRSANVNRYAIHYAFLNGNKDAIKLLLHDIEKPKSRCGPPKISLSKCDTGSYNFYTFGHGVSEIYSSRGSREGNDAFLHDKKRKNKVENYSLLEFCLKHGVSIDTLQFAIEEKFGKGKHFHMENVYDRIWIAIRSGNIELAGYLVSKSLETGYSSFNFLHKEVLLNKTEPLTKFRSQSVKKKSYDNQGILPIHAACINPNAKYLKQLLNSVPEYNIQDRAGFKPVHYASACQGPGPLKLLLSRGIDRSDPAPKGVTPLMIAAKYGRKENIEALIAAAEKSGQGDHSDDNDDDYDDDDVKGSTLNLDAKSKETRAAIHYAASHGHVEAVRALVSHGANINLQTGSYRGNATPLMIAAMKGNLDLVKACIELGAIADKRGKHNMTALMHAVKNGHSPVAAYLLRLGVNPDSSDTSGNTTVHYAAAYGWIHCLRLLIQAGANPNSSNQWKTTPLAVAVMKDHIHCAEYLLSLENCDVNFPDDKGRTLLSQTLASEKAGSHLMRRLQFLVEAKSADVTIPDIDKWTPLHFLAANSIYKSDQRLFKAKWLGLPVEDVTCKEPDSDEESTPSDDGAHPTAPTPPEKESCPPHGNDASMEVEEPPEGDGKEYDDSDLEEDYFKPSSKWRSGGYFSPPPRLVMSRARAACLAAECLVKAGADVNATTSSGETALMVAVLQRNFPLIRKLIELGAKPNIGVNEQGRGVVHLQVMKTEELDIRRFYPEETEDQLKGTVEEQENQRNEFLASQVRRAYSESLNLLISAGADMNAVDKEGFTPLMTALKGGNVELFEVLLTSGADPAIGLDNTGRNLMHMMSGSCLSPSMAAFATNVANRLDKPTRTALTSKVDNTGFTPLLEACETCTKSDNKKEKHVAGRDFIKVLIEAFDADVKCTVGAITQGDRVEYHARDTFQLTVKRKDGEKDKDDEYGMTGKFTCLHFLTRHKDEGTPTCLQVLLGRLAACHDVINSRDRHGRTPLQLAVKWNNLHAVEALVKAGVNLNLKSHNADEDFFGTALIMACDNKLQVVKALIEGKADVNLTDKQNRTALSYAVSSNTATPMVQSLLEAGAHVNTADSHARTPLHYAVNATTGGFESLTETEDLVIKHGGDIAAQDIKGRILLHYAFVKLKKHTDASLSDPVSICSLLLEAMAEHGKDMSKLLNTHDKFGQTPLHRAAIRGATICCLNVLQRGARIDAIDNDGNTPFSLAARHGHHSCAMMFIQMNAPARCDVITPVTPEQRNKYEKQRRSAMWVWQETVNLHPPTPVIVSAFRSVVEHGWQGVAHLMLDTAGLDFMVALRAVFEARKMDLAWTLLRKQRKDSSIQETDSNGLSLLHLLAEFATTFGDVENKIAVHLLQRGVSPSALDSRGALPLHYAAINGNKGLCELLLRYNPSTLNVADPNGMTPLACAFETTSNLATRFELIKMLVSAKPRTLDICYQIGKDDDPDQDSTTPLIQAALHGNENIVKTFLDNNASVNFPKANGRTALMEVIRANEEDMAKVLLYGTIDRAKWTGASTSVDMSAKDKDGWTVVHHCVQNREYGSSENVSMLRLLAKFNSPLTAPDNTGHSPLYYAERQGSGRMEAVLRELIGCAEKHSSKLHVGEPEPGFNLTTSRDAFWDGEEPDVDADAAAMLAEVKDANEEPEYDPAKPPPVDPVTNKQKTGKVFMEPATGIPYDILMTKVDVKYGYFGLNNFYKMQVIFEKGKNLWVLLTRWGRIGDRGQHQLTPFSDAKAATDEFKKIFRSKTGNLWDEKGSFVKHPKKYSLVLPERNPQFHHHKPKDILKPFDLEACPPSKLPKPLQTLMKAITDQEWLRKSVSHHSLQVDPEFMPFGRLSLETINRARGVLEKIWEVQKGIDTNNLRGSEDKFDEIAVLSNEYYTLIPVASYAFERIQPLNSEKDVNAQMDALSRLTDLAFASKLLLAAQYRSKDVNPLDYCFRALGTHVEMMDHTSAECQLLLQYIHNSNDVAKTLRWGRRPNQFKVQGVFRISRPGEGDRMRSHGAGNHRLLWHGTRTYNVLGILKEGLRIAPAHVDISGHSLGKGIYSTDSIQKALSYARGCGGRNEGFLLLSEVALGRQFILGLDGDKSFPESAPKGYDSLLLPTKERPNPAYDVTTPYGVTVPAGEWGEDKTLQERFKEKDSYLDHGRHNEYVVYNEAQCTQRYLVFVGSEEKDSGEDKESDSDDESESESDESEEGI
ncbi:poly [ADP-ribose] polymerase tankyrase isoform X2 [Nematostella vectensis]|uniref:poly [ADP-ribose] polymerase tankyrase isoform X2 n=1 Tax=Nematostella vectensis TaxID=45351 RepID=UPI002077028E|nr:poly [ADP-ribose] polymerase tankyrase isoform X2 [Nematostella vectensis]